MPTPPKDPSRRRAPRQAKAAGEPPAPTAVTPPPASSSAPPPITPTLGSRYPESTRARPHQRSGLSLILPWVLAGALVLAIAVTAGFVTAYLVANSRAVPPPGAGTASATPRRSVAISPVASAAPPSASPSAQPRRTPTPAVVVTPAPSPFEHVVARGESVSAIADLYCVTVEEIVALNNLRNPNRISVGDVLLIPATGCAPSPSPE